MKIKLRHNKRNLLYLEILVFICLSVVYVYIIKDAYAYMGFDSEISGLNIFVGGLFFLSFLVLGFAIRDQFIFVIWHIIFVLVYFGQLIFYQYGEGSIKPVIANSILLLVLFLVSFVRWEFPIFKIKGKILNIVVLTSLVLFIPIFIKYLPHINYRNILLQDIYDTRFYFRAFNDPYFGYLRAPLSRVVLPSLLIIGMIRKKIWLIVLSIFMITFIFLVGALKSVFIGMFAAIFFYWGKRLIDKVYLLLYVFLFFSFFGLIAYIVLDNTFLVNSFVRRILFIPPLIDNYYYMLFENDPLLWSHNSFGSLFFEYPLDRPPNMYVGEVVMQKEGVSANVGLITEGFFSFNFIGVVLHSIFIAFFFLILKQIKLKPVFFGIIFVYIYYINTSFLTILLLTHGMLFCVIYSYFFLNKNYEEKTTSNIK